MCRTTQRNGSLATTRSWTLPQWLVFLLVLAATSTLAAQSPAASGAPDAAAQNQRLGRGVNIIGYDPLWRSPAKARFQERHFALIKEAGFSHVRINLHPFRFWRQVAERYKGQPTEVLFEILNEPNKKLTPEMWNHWLREALAIIRQTNPKRTVVIGPASCQPLRNLPAVERMCL